MLSSILRQNGIQRDQQDGVLTLLADNDRSLTVVDCGKDVSDDFVGDVARALVSNRFVTTLRIRDKPVAFCMDDVAMLCTRTTTLVSLKISYAQLCDDDAALLFAALLGNKSIASVAIDHNKLASADGVVHLLRHNKTLDSLDVSFNNLGAQRDVGLKAIADALGENTTLKQLYLSGNGMSDDAARRFVAVVDQHIHKMNLRVLDIAAENSVRSETKQALKLVLEAGRQLQTASHRSGGSSDGLRPTAALYGARSVASPSSRRGASEVDPNAAVAEWQAGVETESVRALEEEIARLKKSLGSATADRDKAAGEHREALAAAAKMQQQLLDANERSDQLRRDVTTADARSEKRAHEAAETAAVLQAQVAGVRKQLVREQEAAAQDRATLIRTQQALTTEVADLEARLLAATRAADVVVPHTAHTARLTVDCGVNTDEPRAPTPRRAPSPGAQSPRGHAPRPAPAARRRGSFSGETSARGSIMGRVEGAPAPIPKSEWLSDKGVEDCMSCHSEFGVLRRKHHCRLCGKVFCDNCCAPHKAWGIRACPFCRQLHNAS